MVTWGLPRVKLLSVHVPLRSIDSLLVRAKFSTLYVGACVREKRGEEEEEKEEERQRRKEKKKKE
jgi:hypothetical protein